MTFQGRVQNGVIVLAGGSPLPEGALVNVTPIDETAGPSLAPSRQDGPYPVSREQRAALLGLIGIWKTDHTPNDEEVEQIIEEHRMKKYG